MTVQGPLELHWPVCMAFVHGQVLIVSCTGAARQVANPSVIFMDEPTSGLDARAAAIVMRAVRAVGNNGRTVVVTIHQPSIEIFESFDRWAWQRRVC